MNLANLENTTSRRSSILKAPKPRQPLQNVEFSPSSTENSPEITEALKVKRRVNFAEKKHVKEFCDSIEQGTVWDNTYEESESSQTKTSQNSNTDEITFCDEQADESFNKSINNDSKSLRDYKMGDPIFNEDATSDLPVFESVVLDNVIELQNTANTKSIPDNESIGIKYDLHTTKPFNMEKIDFTKDTGSERSILESSLNEFDQKENCEKTLFSNNSMDFTEIVPNILSIDKPEKSVSGRILKSGNKVRDTTQSLQEVKSIEKLLKPQRDQSLVNLNNIYVTEAPTNVASIDNLLQLNSEKTTIFQNTSLDLTNVPNVEGTVVPKSGNDYKLHVGTTVEDQSLELTEAASKIPCNTKSSSLTDVVSHCFHAITSEIRSNIDEKDSDQLTDDSVLNNISMEITRAIPSVLEGRKKRAEQRLSITSGEKNPVMCHDESMELTNAVQVTRAIPSVLERRKNRAKERLSFPSFEKNPIMCHDDSMELTNVVQIIRAIPRVLEGRKNRAEERLSITSFEKNATMCHDESMELTNAVQFPWQRIKDDSDEKDQRKWGMHNLSESEKDGETMIFCDDSMEITRAAQHCLRAEIPSDHNKENRYFHMEDLQESHDQLLPKEHKLKSIEIESSENDVIGMIESVITSSSQENGMNCIDLSQSEEQSSVVFSGSGNISGVVSMYSQTENGNSNNCISKSFESDSRFVASGSEATKLADTQPEFAASQTNTDNHFPLQVSQIENVMDEIKNLSTCSTTYHSLSEMEKNVSEIPMENNRSELMDPNVAPSILAEKLSMPDTAKFNLVTCMRRQADRKDDTVKLLTSTLRNSDIFSSKTDVSEMDSNGLGTYNVEGTELTNGRVHMKAATTKIPDRPTHSNRRTYERLLEEIRSRPYSDSNLRLEDTGFEFSGEIMCYSDYFLVSTMLEELQTKGQTFFSIADKMNILRTESARYVSNEYPKCLSTVGTRIPVHTSILESIKNRTNSLLYVLSNFQQATVMNEFFSGIDAIDMSIANIEEGMTRKKIHGFQTCIEKNITDETLLSSLLPVKGNKGPDKEIQNYPHSHTGFTAAAEFCSESQEGPADKLHRSETVSRTDDLNDNTLKSIKNVDSWKNKNSAIGSTFGNNASTVVNKKQTIEDFPSIGIKNEAQQVTKNVGLSPHKSSFLILKETIESLSKRSQTIWNINRLDEKIVAFNFFSKTIVLAVYLNENSNMSTTNTVKKVILLSQLVEARTDPGVCLAHRLIIEKIDSSSRLHSYRTIEEIPQLLEYVTSEVKLGINFVFELEYLRNQNLMEIRDDRIIFVARTRKINAGIIVNVVIQIKVFERIDYNNISVSCLLGNDKIKKMDIEKLITNVKKDHRFLRFYIADVRNYIDLMAETDSTTNIK